MKLKQYFIKKKKKKDNKKMKKNENDNGILLKEKLIKKQLGWNQRKYRQLKRGGERNISCNEEKYLGASTPIFVHHIQVFNHKWSSCKFFYLQKRYIFFFYRRRCSKLVQPEVDLSNTLNECEVVGL